ncbi:MAG: hypothetical protein V1872_09220 [bacterium]
MNIKNLNRLYQFVVLIILIIFILSYLNPKLIFSNTTPTGGDIPAHVYLVSHLKKSLINKGKIISWAQGWWAGFPMYQYYFCLPYILMAILSFLIPVNIAFKIIANAGIVLLPISVFFSLKWMKFEDEIPSLGAISTILFLFTTAHNMWGVNIYSTLAGEIANSISFVIMVLFLGSFYKDIKQVRFSLWTVILYILLFYSHFFTTIVASVTVFFLPFLFKGDQIKKRVVIYLKTSILTFLLAAWWIIPLLNKNGYSVEFGGDWKLTLWKTFPNYTIILIILVLIAFFKAIISKRPNILYCFTLFFLSIIAFYTGGRINASFTNIRFWPFIFYELHILAAIGLGILIKKIKARQILVVILMILVLMAVDSSKNDIRNWFKWNYEGLEGKADYNIFRKLLMPLDGTKGRLANDLHEDNNFLGSTRVFETVPALIDKNILEGGIVNSATGSMFSYYIQGETSKDCAGFPINVQPTSFDIYRATKHLELFNVKHFIAYWDKTKEALQSHPQWKLLKSIGNYKLFELATNEGNYVYIPKHYPIYVDTKHWKDNSLEWIYNIDAIDYPFVFLKKNDLKQIGEPIIKEDKYLEFLGGLMKLSDGTIPLWLTLGPFPYSSDISNENADRLEPVHLNKLTPQTGKKQYGFEWKPILRDKQIIFYSIYPKRDEFFINYSFTKIFSSIKQVALLHYSHDDTANIFLNGKQIVNSKITGMNNYKTIQIELKDGENTILHKLQQGEGGAFFHLRLTDLQENPLHNVHYSISNKYTNVIPDSIKEDYEIKDEYFGDERISFKTEAIGKPHIIKCSYFPNWKVKGADQIYHVTPNFMLVFPKQKEVILYYGSTPSDIIGQILTFVGIIIFIILLILKFRILLQLRFS